MACRLRSTHLRFLLAAAVVVLLAAGCGINPGEVPGGTEPVGGPLLERVFHQRERNQDEYHPDLFPIWTDADDDDCDTRQEVLIAESLTPVSVSDDCTLTGGSWISPYDGLQISGDTARIAVDHIVPLSEVWESGAHRWDLATRQAYANDLTYEHTLVAVSRVSMQDRAERDPAEWLPPEPATHCWYASAWVAVKLRWRLNFDSDELDTLIDLEEQCGGLIVTQPPTL